MKNKGIIAAPVWAELTLSGVYGQGTLDLVEAVWNAHKVRDERPDWWNVGTHHLHDVGAAICFLCRDL